MNEADLELVRALPLLDGLSRDETEHLLSAADIREYRKGALLFAEGGSPDCLFVLLSGMVELFTSNGGRDEVILLIWPPETFMPAAALTNEPYLVSARTLGRTRLLAFDAARVREEVQASHELTYRLTRILAGQFRMTIRHIKDMKLRSATRRLAAFLLRLVDETGKQGCADLPVAKAIIASRLGLSPETLSRSLKALRDEGLIVRGSRIIVADRQKLELYCQPNPLIDGRELALAVTAI